MTPSSHEGTYQLSTVVSCRGPDDIEVAAGGQRSHTLRLEDLVPVTSEGIEDGMRIFRRGLIGWELTKVARVDGAMMVVKHPGASFQDDFFDTTVSSADVRLPLDPAKRGAPRSSFARTLDRISRGFAIVRKIIGILITIALVLLFLWIFWTAWH